MLIWEEKSAIRSDAYVVTRVRGTRKALLRYICESWRRDQPHGRKVLATDEDIVNSTPLLILPTLFPSRIRPSTLHRNIVNAHAVALLVVFYRTADVSWDRP